MGDRANVYMKESESAGVYLYTHWGGSELALTVQTSLKRGQERWSDTPYLARIILADMTAGHERDLTGFGISSGLCDNEHAIIVVDCARGLVGFAEEPPESAPEPPRIAPGHNWTFKQYCALSSDAIERAWAIDRHLEKYA